MIKNIYILFSIAASVGTPVPQTPSVLTPATLIVLVHNQKYFYLNSIIK